MPALCLEGCGWGHKVPWKGKRQSKVDIDEQNAALGLSDNMSYVDTTGKVVTLECDWDP